MNVNIYLSHCLSRFIFFIVDILGNIIHTGDLRRICLSARSSAVEHLTFNQRVTGSNPVGHAIILVDMFYTIPSCVQEYLPIVIFFVIAIVVSLVAIGIPLIFSENRPYKAKLSPYECGFKEFGDARSRFDIRFYLVAILFIIFDIEVIFLFPWSVVLKDIGIYGYFSMMIFLAVLIVGFIYEWKKGALEWE